MFLYRQIMRIQVIKFKILKIDIMSHFFHNLRYGDHKGEGASKGF